jgi:hypothetical protein
MYIVLIPILLTFPFCGSIFNGGFLGWVSSDQAKLAQALRSKQLQSTVFAVCIIQVKPHLEQVLSFSTNYKYSTVNLFVSSIPIR